MEHAERFIDRLAPGQPLHWRQEPDNPLDNLAVHLADDGRAWLGYVPLYLVQELAHLIERQVPIEITAVRRNPPPAPVRERLLCRLAAGSVEDFTPFATERYRPIPTEAAPYRFTQRELAG